MNVLVRWMELPHSISSTRLRRGENVCQRRTKMQALARER
uniref:Uncharacterized protein n=1 Tax=Anguilla anguilla TaxID=7936 RepID=A0A0E9UL16_ANGAN